MGGASGRCGPCGSGSCFSPLRHWTGRGRWRAAESLGLGIPRLCQPPLPPPPPTPRARSWSPFLHPLFGFGVWAGGEAPELAGMGIPFPSMNEGWPSVLTAKPHKRISWKPSQLRSDSHNSSGALFSESLRPVCHSFKS